MMNPSDNVTETSPHSPPCRSSVCFIFIFVKACYIFEIVLRVGLSLWSSIDNPHFFHKDQIHLRKEGNHS